MTALGFAQTTPQGRHDMVDAREKRIAQIHRCTDTPGGYPMGESTTRRDWMPAAHTTRSQAGRRRNCNRIDAHDRVDGLSGKILVTL